MPFAEQSILLRGNIDTIFLRTNDLEQWPSLFVEYGDVRVLSKTPLSEHCWRLVFELTDVNGNTWQSRRLVDKHHYIASAQRVNPLFPFLYMNILWLYVQTEDGVKMTWMQDFEVDPHAGRTNESMLAYMLGHMKKNQEHIKAFLEAQEEKIVDQTP